MIKVYSGEYDRKEFYGMMGGFFAEPRYRKSMPYLKNKKEYTWLINIEDDKVIAFTAYEVKYDKIEFAFDFYKNDIKDLWVLTEMKLEQLKDLDKPIETATSNPSIYKMFTNAGFEEFRKTKNYKFLVLESQEEEEYD